MYWSVLTDPANTPICTQLTFNVTSLKITDNDVRRRYVVELIRCEITMEQDKIWFIVDGIFGIEIIIMYITHKIYFIESVIIWFYSLKLLQTEIWLAQNWCARPTSSGVLKTKFNQLISKWSNKICDHKPFCLIFNLLP